MKVVLVLAVTAMMVPGGLQGVQVHASTCVAGLNPGLHFTLLVPTSNPARRTWAAIIQSSLQCLGMSVDRVELPFSPNIYDRALTPPKSDIGKTFDQGGFDILFVGYNLGIDADPFSLYDSSQFAPSGGNYYLWNNTQNDNLDRAIKTTLNATIRNNLVEQWQDLAYKDLPSIPILYDRGIVAYDSAKFPNAQGVFNVYHFPAWPPVEHLTDPTAVPFILAETGQAPGEGIIPELSTSYYDLAVSSEIFSPLALRNDTIFKNMDPDLASSWSVASDNKTWTVNIRSGVTWQDTQPFTADDVKFTFDLIQNDTFGSPTESFVTNIVGGINNVTETSPTQVVFHLPQPYAYFVQNILGAYPILPKHILSAFSKDYSKISGSLFNRPDIGSSAVSSSLPIGTGPYKYVSYDSASTTNHLTKNTSYYNFPDWGTGNLTAKGQFQVTDYYVRTIVGGDQAVTAFSNGEVNFLDSQYHLETQLSFLNTIGTSKYSVYDDFGVQEMGVNMEHPILGTGTATPYAQAHPGNATAAADAAMWIRQAISYATPRDRIISQLLNGYGIQAITTPVVGNYQTGFALTQGFNTALQPYPYNLTTAENLLQQAGYTQTSGSSLGQYTLIIVVAVVVAIVAVAAVYMLRVRRKPSAGGVSMPSTPPPPTTRSFPYFSNHSVRA
ncbi:MAG TPA: ABC transporter substrate-binding protein [Candidatus Dormibacteraeota bacterium]|nr:ABC transporter substrate-binding protein [Candidatus Dormibacteraeota bacterium]